MVTKQALTNMIKLARIDEYYADTYDDVEAPTREEANAYLSDGNTLIISVVRNKRPPFNQRKAKKQWLIRNGADVNKRDCSRRYFPPISHAIQAGECVDSPLTLWSDALSAPNQQRFHHRYLSLEYYNTRAAKNAIQECLCANNLHKFTEIQSAPKQ